MGSTELAVRWLCAFHCHQPAPAPPPQSTSECIYLHLYCSRLKAIIVRVQGGQRVSHLLIQRGLKIFPLMLSWCNRPTSSEHLKKSPRCIWNALASLHSCAVRISDRGMFVCWSINRHYSGRRPRFNDNCLPLFVTNLQICGGEVLQINLIRSELKWQS